MKEGKGTAACYHTVCAGWYFKPASGSELDEAARVGVAPGGGRAAGGGAGGVVLEGHSSLSLPPVHSGVNLSLSFSPFR